LFVWSRSNNIHHDNIAHLFGLYYDPINFDFYPTPGLVSLFIEHELKEYATSRPEEKLRLMSETAEGVRYLHSRRVIHGDLKPENVRVTKDGQVKIMDLGMGKIENVGGCTTTFVPNPRYFAPELFDEDFRPTYESDIYSFGMLLLQILHGTDLDPSVPNFDRSLPFNDFRSNNCLWKLIVDLLKGRRPLQKRYNVTQPQWEFLERCWLTDPAQRPSIEQVVACLPQIL